MKYCENSMKDVQICYIGGGSRGWAWTFMTDLALEERLSGTIRLYDIDRAAAHNNELIGNHLSERPEAVGKWKYEVKDTYEEALTGADFVVISILPGTFDEMESDVHTPESYGIYQSVGDTAGPGGMIRALRTLPMFAEFAEQIKKFCPNAWVINYTNPMSLCVKQLYKTFPAIKAFGCCHEVFGTQEMLAGILEKEGVTKVKPDRHDIIVNVLGINHFTWFSSASYKGIDIFPIYRHYIDTHMDEGYCPEDYTHWANKSFACKHRVKFDLFNRFGLIAAAGDRHLVEFMPGDTYLKDPETVDSWDFGLTAVAWRKNELLERLEKSRKLASFETEVELKATGEEGILLIKALCGLDRVVSNVNIPNTFGQILNLPREAIVETNALFERDAIRPVAAGEVPDEVCGLLMPHIENHERIMKAVETYDRQYVYDAFEHDPLIAGRLSHEQTVKLADDMINNTLRYLPGGWQKKETRPIRVLQFGEGNFLRAFVDHMIDIANEKGRFDGDIVIVKPRNSGSLDKFKAQDCRYTVRLQGLVDGKPGKLTRLITSVADALSCYADYDRYAGYAKLDTLRFIVSNTTEAGIVFDPNDRFEMNPPESYPGKLAKFLYERYKHFEGATDKGLIILPVELIDDNGLHLKECVLKQADNWKLEQGFTEWVNNACVFTSTLVDRIVTGYPKDEAEELFKELGYRDELIVTGEPFGLWVIESPVDISDELPLHKAGLPVVFTDDHHPYKQRKVRILNGAHTSFVLASYLCGNDYVLQSMNDELVLRFIKATLYDEVIPTLELPKKELDDFAEDVLARFANPFVKHAHLSIALNSVSKWRTRCMPSFLDYIEKKGGLPEHLTFSLAALMRFYTGSELRDGALIGHRGDEEYRISDDKEVLEFFAANSTKGSAEFTHAVLSHTEFWGRDLSVLPGVEERVSFYVEKKRTKGMRTAMEELF